MSENLTSNNGILDPPTNLTIKIGSGSRGESPYFTSSKKRTVPKKFPYKAS